MTPFRFVALPGAVVQALREDQALDANGQPPERHRSDGAGLPCRHCLAEIAAGESYLILAYRPFPAPQPYAEVGPIFLHARACLRHPDSPAPPAMFLGWPRLLMRGYGHDHRIVYGTGEIVPTGELAGAAAELLARPEIAYLHLRSASNNCYLARVERVFGQERVADIGRCGFPQYRKNGR